MRFAVILHVILLSFAIVSCRTKYIPGESRYTVIRDTVYQRDSILRVSTTNTKDSVITKDSVVYVVDENGNILRKELYRQKEIYKDLQRDYNELVERYNKLKFEKIDTVTKSIIVEVEKELSGWEQIQMDVGMVSMVLVLLIVVFLIYKKVGKR